MAKSKAAIQADGSVIIGGGIAGLAMATALRNVASVSGIKILEASSHADFTNNKAGAAAQLGPNGLRALKFITSDDVMQKVLDVGGELEGNVMNMPGGQSMVMPDTTKADTGIPQVLIGWGMLRSLLAEQLDKDTIITDSGRDVVGYDSSANSDSGHIHLIDASGNHLDMPTTPLIVGADGVRSTFRSLIRKSTNNIMSTGAESASGEDVKYGGRINVKAVVNKSLGDEYKSRHTYAAFAPDGSVAIFAM